MGQRDHPVSIANPLSPRVLSTPNLLIKLKQLVEQERESTVDVLLHLNEVDSRSAFAEEAFPSLFLFCVRELGYSEGAAYRRIRTARLAAEYPRVYIHLRRGSLSLTTASLIAPHMCEENYRSLLDQASGKTRADVERLLAPFIEQKSSPDNIRFLGLQDSRVQKSGGDKNTPLLLESSTPQRSESMQPEEEPKEEQDAAPSIRRVRFRFEGNESLLEKIRRAQEILRHKFPKGSLEEIVDQALEDLLEKRDPWRGIKRRERRKRAREAENQSPP